MNSQNPNEKSTRDLDRLQESRSERFNLPVTHPSKWRLIRDVFFSAPNHTYRYRHQSNRMRENTIRTLNSGDCK